MKFISLRTLFPTLLGVALAGCGGADPEGESAFQTTTLGQVIVVPAGVAARPAPSPAAVPAVAANMPQPDCAADGCKRLRVIDGNAEAYRLDHARNDAPQS